MASPRHIHNDDIYEKSNILSKEVHAHDPFVVVSSVMIDGSPEVQVEVVKTLDELLANYADTQKVLWQWEGDTASHFFELTVGDIRVHV